MTSPPSKSLAGKVALVTGAGKGIGRAIALAYGREGAAVCCVARTLADVESAAAQIVAEGGRALAVAADVGQHDSIAQGVQRCVEAFGGLDIAVLNAGLGGQRQPFMAISPEAWQEMINVNLNGAAYSARAVVPAMKARGGGKIIFMGSGLGHSGSPGTASYACAKAGMAMLNSVLAQELWADGISVNEILPGPVDTGLAGPIIQPIYEQLKKMGEWVKTPQDVVPLALYLATQAAPGSTGQTFSLARRPL